MDPSARDAVLDALWKRVSDDFDSDKAHEAFLSHCQQSNALPEAARRYRDFEATLNEDQTAEREAIKKRLGAIAILAMSQLDTRRTPPSNRRLLRALTIVAAILAVASVIGLAQAVIGR